MKEEGHRHGIRYADTRATMGDATRGEIVTAGSAGKGYPHSRSRCKAADRLRGADKSSRRLSKSKTMEAIGGAMPPVAGQTLDSARFTELKARAQLEALPRWLAVPRS